MKILENITEAMNAIQKGQVIAYPTEAVYGLGCDPFNRNAVEKIFAIKGRRAEKGLILIISEWSQLWPLVQRVPKEKLKLVFETWPGPFTWVFPKSRLIPDWVSGEFETIAIRMTNHPIARKLCAQTPLISTSANLSGNEAITKLKDLQTTLGEKIDGFVEGELGELSKPSEIRDVFTGVKLR